MTGEGAGGGIDNRIRFPLPLFPLPPGVGRFSGILTFEILIWRKIYDPMGISDYDS
jgi:hypothetical protein